MTRDEAIARIEDHKIVHKMNEPRAIYISEALDMAIKALEQEPCEDAISREAVIRIAEQGQVQGYEWQFKELIKLPPVTPQLKTRWIPVSERLPKEEGLYLVSVKNDHERRYSKTCWFHGNGNWFARQDVIAWMPLPEPYKAESEE